MRFPNYKQSLTMDVMLQMAVRVSIVIIAVSALTYWHIYKTLVSSTIDGLEQYIQERGQRESGIFKLAESNHEIFRATYLAHWQQDFFYNDKFFWHAFERRPDQTIHLQKKAYDGYFNHSGLISKDVTAYIGANAPIENNAFRKKLLLAYTMVDHFGVAWTRQFANLYVSMPENVNIVYWPGVRWADNATSKLNVLSEEWVYITTRQNNPNRESVWTGLYYDPTALEWMVSLETPIDITPTNTLNIGHDILLNALFDRVFKDHLSGTYNFIFREDGRLIAHPAKRKEMDRTRGMLMISKLKDTQLNHYFQTLQAKIQKKQADYFIVEAEDEFLAVSKIEGPGWWFVTVYPKSLLSSPSLKAAKFILIVSLFALVIELVMLYLVMMKKVVKPLETFMDASSAIEGQRYEKITGNVLPLPDHLDNEIGKLAKLFKSMSGSLQNFRSDMQRLTHSLEDQVKVRTRELQRAKDKAEKEATIDSLTQIPNRHSFYNRAKALLQQADHAGEPLCFLMLDIDLFKMINDTYGHPQGDQVLVACARTIENTIREKDLLGRLGGEEFAVVLPNTSLEEARVIAERIRVMIAELSFYTAQRTQSFHTTISIGISCATETIYAYELLYKHADLALYEAKQSGRNLVISYAGNAATPEGMPDS
ncbi:diguanylate cyclase domain-containing protein [Methylophilus sp. 5]|uniref:diguanylate cyclase domain-containing protein n=1 Tax=Methylophilus sp. 5 TaxID=1112274 RepID=UPI0004B2A0D1|nr:diguanylate cyclase [Methylophilus sp. 5]